MAVHHPNPTPYCGFVKRRRNSETTGLAGISGRFLSSRRRVVFRGRASASKGPQLGVSSTPEFATLRPASLCCFFAHASDRHRIVTKPCGSPIEPTIWEQDSTAGTVEPASTLERPNPGEYEKSRLPKLGHRSIQRDSGLTVRSRASRPQFVLWESQQANDRKGPSGERETLVRAGETVVGIFDDAAISSKGPQPDRTSIPLRGRPRSTQVVARGRAKISASRCPAAGAPEIPLSRRKFLLNIAGSKIL